MRFNAVSILILSGLFLFPQAYKSSNSGNTECISKRVRQLRKILTIGIHSCNSKNFGQDFQRKKRRAVVAKVIATTSAIVRWIDARNIEFIGLIHTSVIPETEVRLYRGPPRG